MNKQCVNCPGATDHTTAECPVMCEASAPIDPIHSAMMLGMTPEPCEPVIEITRQAVTKLLDVVEFGDQLERVEKDRLVAFVKDLLAQDQPELWAMYSPGPGEVHPCMSKEHAEREAKATLEVCEKMRADRIARGQSVEFWPNIVVEVIPSPFTPLEHFEMLAEETIQHRDDLVEYVKELEQKAEAPAPAVVNQQVTTAAIAPDALEQARRHLSNAIEDAEDGKAAASLPALREAAHFLALAAAPAAQPAAIFGKYGNVLRPFIAMMEAELHANTGKGDRPGWLAMSPEQCLLEIYYHTAKLQKAVKNNDMKGVREYTADVANMSMMLADTCGWLDVVSSELAANEQKPMADLIREHRIAITPEHEGQWHADLYGSEAEPLARAEGATPEEAVAAVVALYHSLQEQQP